jgi:citrate lyase beta subunit
MAGDDYPEVDWICRTALKRNEELEQRYQQPSLADLPARYLVQYAHLTVPATVEKYIEGAAGTNADLVMIDLEDSIPRDREDLLAQGRENIARAFTDLNWAGKIRTFRPRGLSLDPSFSDIAWVVTRVGDRIDGLIYPKVESAAEVQSIDRALTELEKTAGLESGALTLQVLIESVGAEQRVFEIATASRRLRGLIFGAFDYWSSLNMPRDLYHPDHPIVRDVRCRIVKAAASAGLPAIAEMTTNYPTKNKTEEEKRAALSECRSDAELARRFGFAGKWTGIPVQVDPVREVFELSDETIRSAVVQAKAFAEAEKAGRGAAMIDGKMADRATDRINRVVLKQAHVLGRLDQATAEVLGIG